MESENTRSSSDSNERRSSRNRTESPRPGAKENSEKDKIPPPPPKGAKTKDESVCKYFLNYENPISNPNFSKKSIFKTRK